MLEYGILVFLGLVAVAAKLPRRVFLRLLGFPITVDLSVTTLVYVTHGGTFSGLMVAAICGLATSLFTSGARWAVGYIERGCYFPGRLVKFDPESLK